MTDVIRMASRAFHLPKAGHSADEYEDAVAGDVDRGRFAVADGASESAFADAWAKILVEAFVQTPGPWSGWLAAARERWCTQIQGRELPWFAETKFQEGAYAALLGVVFHKSRWRADAVGDCCFFQVRDGALHRSFPMRRSDEFGNRPSLMGSRKRGSTQPRARRMHLRGNLNGGDVIFLMTDALAQWFLTEVEDGQRPWSDLQTIATEAQFISFIDSLRESKKLRNDDVTLMLIQPLNP